MFEFLYLGLAAALVVILSAAAATGLMRWRRPGEDRTRQIALGIALAAGSLEVALLAGVLLDSIKETTGELFFQRAHFAIFYVAFATLLYGSDRVASNVLDNDRNPLAPRIAKRFRLALWSGYALTVLVALWALAGAGSPSASPGQGAPHVPQQPIYSLPVFYSLVISAIAMLALAARLRKGSEWPLLVCFAAATLFGLLGSLREAAVIPSSGDPVGDLLLAFGPFTCTGACLYASVRLLGARVSA